MSARNFGLKPKTQDGRDFLLSAQTLPPVPKKVFGHGNTFAGDAWKMLGNGPDQTAPGAAAQGCGDCVWASADHETMLALTDAGQSPADVAALFDGSTAVADYAEFTGYDPQNGEGDNGTEIREALKQRASTGIRDLKGNRHKVGLYVSVDPQNTAELLAATYWFEAVTLGVTVTQANEEAFSKAEGSGATAVWTHSRSEELGGHCIPIVGRPDEEHFAALTWARRIFLTPSFIADQVQEAWAYLSPERISKVTGKSYEGASETVLEEYLSLVKG